MKKNWTQDERDELCRKLDMILGADIEEDERDAIRDAISIISPAYAKAMEDWEIDGADFAQSAYLDIIGKQGLADEDNK